MKITGIFCHECNKIIYSRAGHDFHWCMCPDQQGCFVDGGFNYTRSGGSVLCSFSVVSFDLDVDKSILYNDWNRRENNFGIVDPAVVSFTAEDHVSSSKDREEEKLSWIDLI